MNSKVADWSELPGVKQIFVSCPIIVICDFIEYVYLMKLKLCIFPSVKRLLMKTHFTSLRLFILSTLLIIASGLQSQSIVFKFTDGNTESFPLSQVRKITFSGTILNLHLTDETTESWDVNVISHYSFDNTVGLPAVNSTPVVSDMKVFPNPSSGAVTISYFLNKSSNVGLEIYDLQGKMVKKVFSSVQTAGKQKQSWNGTDENGQTVGRGQYVCRLNVNGEATTQAIILQ